MFGGLLYEVTSLLYVNFSRSNGSTITIPAIADVYDLAVLFVTAEADNSSSYIPVPGVTPNGWTLIGERSVRFGTGSIDEVRQRVSYKILQQGDAGSTITGMNGTTDDAKIIKVFRPNNPISRVIISNFNSEATGANPVAQTISASGQNTPLIVFGSAYSPPGGTAFSTETPAFAVKINDTQADMVVGHTVYNINPANHTIDMNDLGIQILTSFLLQVE
jgi:hypothetical protein